MNNLDDTGNGHLIKVGTRGSALALTQTGHVIDTLSEANPEVEIDLVIIKTTGDIDRRQNLVELGVGVYVRELETALLDRRIDIAVHSLKDMPSSLPPEFALAAVPYREDPRDALVSRNGETLEELPAGSRVATGSARRQALVKNLRPDLIVEPVRGNVPIRLAKLDEQDGPDAVILATAGLNRLGLQDRITQHLSCSSFVSAVGQGALALETRADDSIAIQTASKVNHNGTLFEVTAERAFLDEIGGGCSAPVSAHAKNRNGKITFSAFASTPDGTEVIRENLVDNAVDAEKIGRNIGKLFVERGARDLVSEDVN
ncbi:MAG TPA: hydroxymethylbilane synthase [Dehalococcoidia bacterium]|jgi:hydroxymethylbilane synthase|nr:hydroxymethylbilane synthase [Chloroflexota bacterium]MDP6056580.1 hydroxymethylbilane synthase [Dehalococcoidia bacterium]MDP7262611.1 hydroxymethylbilane synthase [Dehalococcoidia bacterium]MDP7484650.1 hydroxymethylbilane synthase [Dehalococcoidia bacterium]HJP27513.1 hydroxymethylbilane synthase [Dehalococcoidia bacterium]|tara:strand:+ start:2526 stop:3473 length:948 start_codon:yes stop_codon:yes gene_type:complete